LTKQVEAMIEKSNCNKKEDKGKLRDLYIELTKPEKVMAGGEGEEQKEWPWIGKTCDHAPLVAAIASLTSLQVEVLGARASAFEHIKSRVSTGEFSFNSIEGFAVGPTMVTQGDVAELKVMMAAFDTDNQPVITGGGNWTVANGQGTMKIATSGLGDKKLSGTVKIRKKSGDWAEKPWSYTVKVIKAAGSIELLDMNVLYKGWKNRVRGVASGYDESSLGGEGCKIYKSGADWVAEPTVPAGSTATIYVTGKNSITKKSARVGELKVRVKPLPPAQVFFGKAGNNQKGIKTDIFLSASYGKDALINPTFTVTSWEVEFAGRKAKGTGTKIDAAATALLKTAGSGSSAYFTVTYKGPDGTKTSVIRVNF